MKIAIAYSTKDQVELTKQTFPVLRDGQHALYWCDGSKTDEGRAFFFKNSAYTTHPPSHVTGGADAAIAWKLSTLLAAPQGFTHIGLLENDVLLDNDWFEPTMALFEQGRQDGLHVGAVSARSYVDRVLIQRDRYAVMHNLGAGMVVFTRQAAELVLRSFRTHWWPDNRKLFAQLAGIDLATYAAFRGQEQFVTTDWGWEAQLASHGLASLALTPAKCQMIGQNPPLAQQGLELTAPGVFLTVSKDERGDRAFDLYRTNLVAIRERGHTFELPGTIHRDGAGMLFYPHQLGYLAGGPTWQGTLELMWSQGFGPFAYRAGPGGASLSVRISGSCSFLATGGDAGAKVRIADTRSGFNFAPQLPPALPQHASITVPGGPISRAITMEMDEGAVFCGLSTTEPQMLDSTFRFDWSQLPEAK
jgi:hypothetical protein